MTDDLAAIGERLAALDRLTDAKFITMAQLVESQAAKVELALNAAEKAITKAEMATEKRFDSVNEFRAALADQTSKFITREVYEAAAAAAANDRQQLHNAIADLRLDQRTGNARIVGIAVGVSSAVTIIGILFSIATGH